VFLFHQRKVPSENNNETGMNGTEGPADSNKRQKLNPPDPNVQKLFQACKVGNIDDVRALVVAGVNVNHNLLKFGTPLIYVCEKGDRKDIIDVLIAAGANVNARSHAGTTPLRAACQRGDLETVKTLLAAGADVHNRTPKQQAIVFDVVEAGHPQVLSELIAAKADVNAFFGGYNPLMKAVQKGEFECAKILLNAGANVNSRN
jgi:uncharacterized protein